MSNDKKETAKEVGTQEQFIGKCSSCHNYNKVLVPIGIKPNFCTNCGQPIRYTPVISQGDYQTDIEVDGTKIGKVMGRYIGDNKKEIAQKVPVQEQLNKLAINKTIAIAFNKLEPLIFNVELIIGDLKLKGRALQIVTGDSSIYDIRYLEIDS